MAASLQGEMPKTCLTRLNIGTPYNVALFIYSGFDIPTFKRFCWSFDDKKYINNVNPENNCFPFYKQTSGKYAVDSLLVLQYMVHLTTCIIF